MNRCKFCLTEFDDLAGDTCWRHGWIDPPSALPVPAGLQWVPWVMQWKMNRSAAALARLYWFLFRKTKEVFL